MRSERAERIAGYFVVFAIFVSAAVAAYEAVAPPDRPPRRGSPRGAGGRRSDRLRGQLARGNRPHTRGRALDSPALIADGNHAKADAYVSLAVVASAAAVALGLQLADPLIGLGISVLIMRITWQSWRTVRDGHAHSHSH